MPCQRVSTTGRYFFGSVLNWTVAPAARFRLTLLSRWMAPVDQVPAGTVTRPPPAALHAAIALPNAAVLSELPGFAPKLVMGKSFAGNVGGMIRARIVGTRSHGLLLAASAAVPAVPASSAPPAV